MNRNICSSECMSGACGLCEYEDCACKCHLREFIERDHEHSDDDYNDEPEERA